jgi:hypothetical protein
MRELPHPGAATAARLLCQAVKATISAGIRVTRCILASALVACIVSVSCFYPYMFRRTFCFSLPSKSLPMSNAGDLSGGCAVPGSPRSRRRRPVMPSR